MAHILITKNENPLLDIYDLRICEMLKSKVWRELDGDGDKIPYEYSPWTAHYLIMGCSEEFLSLNPPLKIMFRVVQENEFNGKLDLPKVMSREAETIEPLENIKLEEKKSKPILPLKKLHERVQEPDKSLRQMVYSAFGRSSNLHKENMKRKLK